MSVVPLYFSFPDIGNVHCLFTRRQNGDLGWTMESVRQWEMCPRKKFFCHLKGLGVEKVAVLNQVHGADLLIEPDGQSSGLDFHVSPPDEKADGMATSASRLALIIRTADCQPILFSHISGKYIMALHVGWRGNRINFIGSAICRFCDAYGIEAGELMAVRGPSLGPCCSEFVNFSNEWGDDFLPWLDTQKRHMNLWNLTRDQLLSTGLKNKNIFSLDICTRCNHELFFSYRADRTAYRQCGLIWREGSPQDS